jgi:hypothetical protein
MKIPRNKPNKVKDLYNAKCKILKNEIEKTSEDGKISMFMDQQN